MKINGPHGVMDSVTRQAAGQHASGCAGLFGYGLVTDRNGDPISPGGLRMTGELLDRAGFAIADHVVDVGCGQGRSLGVMIRRGLNVVGVDTDAAPLAMARNLFPNVDLFCCSGAAMPIDNEAMDGVLSECVLTVMPDHRAALAEWFRVLRAGGKLALCDVYARNPDMSGSDERAIRLLSADRVRKAIGTAGFQLLYFEDRSECLRNFVARFIFRFGSLDALWGDARTSAQMHALKPGYYMAIAVKPIDRPANTNRANSQGGNNMTEDSFRVAELLLADLKCSHIMMILALEAAGRQDPDLVRAMSGLAVGMGQGMTCGILSAGSCVVGMLAGKAGEDESEDSRFVDILEEFGGWFKHRCTEEYGGCNCSDIMQFDMNLKARRCPALIAESWQKLNEILDRYDVDIAHPPRGSETCENTGALEFLS